MDIFASILAITVLVLLGNLWRLFTCTIKNWKKTPEARHRARHVALFIMYCIITAFFVHAGVVTLCNIWCETAPLF